MNLDLLRKHFGDVRRDTFEQGSALIGKGAWEDHDSEMTDAPHPEWEPHQPDDEPEEVVEEEPEAKPLAKGGGEIVDRGERLVARFAPGMDGFNTLEVGTHFALSL